MLNGARSLQERGFVTKIVTNLKTGAARLRLMSVVFAVELRLKIVTEMYMRAMSPTQFFEEFGGGSISRVTRNVKRLEKVGWLEYVRSAGPGGSRRGGVEHFYRATELAFFDAETWATLPYSLRVAFSWNSFKQIAWRLRAAIEANRIEPDSSRSLTHDTLQLDGTGWKNVVKAVQAHFDLLFAEQKSAAPRLARSEAEPIRASVVHIAFEAPGEEVTVTAPRLAKGGGESFIPLPVRLSKVFDDPVCMAIVAEANRREVSAARLLGDVGEESIAAIRRRLRKLSDLALVKEVKSKTGGKRRGAREKFYRATAPSFLDEREGPWEDVPESLAQAEAWQTFEELSAVVKEAMRIGVLDARDDSCLAWSLIQLDERGWKRVIAELEKLRKLVAAEQRRARARMKKSGEKPITFAIALAAFESPKESEREP